MMQVKLLHSWMDSQRQSMKKRNTHLGQEKLLLTVQTWSSWSTSNIMSKTSLGKKNSELNRVLKIKDWVFTQQMLYNHIFLLFLTSHQLLSHLYSTLVNSMYLNYRPIIVSPHLANYVLPQNVSNIMLYSEQWLTAWSLLCLDKMYYRTCISLPNIHVFLEQ